MKKCIVLPLIVMIIGGCASADIKRPQREFNFNEFTGLVSKQVKAYEDVVLDYELDDTSGKTIHLKSCRQVDSIREDQILSSEYELYKILSHNCAAIKLYIEKGGPAKSSFFPERLTKELISEFPAVAGPRISRYSLEQRAGKTLKEYEPVFEVVSVDKNTVEVMTENYELTYLIMAKADFNVDGYEDLLVAVRWHVRDAFGKGADLFILEKKSLDYPITLTWRY